MSGRKKLRLQKSCGGQNLDPLDASHKCSVEVYMIKSYNTETRELYVFFKNPETSLNDHFSITLKPKLEDTTAVICLTARIAETSLPEGVK